MSETLAVYTTHLVEAMTFGDYFTALLKRSGIKHNGDWREYERGKVIARDVCQSDDEYNEAVQIIAKWVGV